MGTPDPVQEARTLRSSLRVQEAKLAGLMFECRQTVEESRRLIAISRVALVKLEVMRKVGRPKFRG